MQRKMRRSTASGNYRRTRSRILMTATVIAINTSNNPATTSAQYASTKLFKSQTPSVASKPDDGITSHLPFAEAFKLLPLWLWTAVWLIVGVAVDADAEAEVKVDEVMAVEVKSAVAVVVEEDVNLDVAVVVEEDVVKVGSSEVPLAGVDPTLSFPSSSVTGNGGLVDNVPVVIVDVANVANVAVVVVVVVVGFVFVFVVVETLKGTLQWPHMYVH